MLRREFGFGIFSFVKKVADTQLFSGDIELRKWNYHLQKKTQSELKP